MHNTVDQLSFRFQDYADKSTVWAARNKNSDSSLFISENFSTETELNRKKIYIIYKYAKSLEKYKTKISLNGDTLIIDSNRYTVDNLIKLPPDLSPRHFYEKSFGSFLVFSRIVSEFSPFRNWYPCDIKSDAHAFRSLEQAYKFRKAVYCDDKASAVKLQHTTDPRRANELGLKISG